MPKTLTFVGDICLAGRPSLTSVSNAPPLSLALRSLASPETCLVGTIEAPISSRGSPKPHKACLRADPIAAAALAGFDVGLLGNNHIEDFGPEAAGDTQAALAKLGCQVVGYGNNLGEALAPAVVDLGGVRLAILSLCCPTTRADGFATERQSGVAPISMQLLRDAIRQAKENAELVVVCPHWGTQGSCLPGLDDIQLARAAIEAGAAAVIGTHAHVVQSCETYLGAPIAYGLGNYLFDDLDVALVDHAGVLTGKRYKVEQSEANRTSLAVELKVCKSADGWRLDWHARWMAYQSPEMSLRHEKINLPTRADKMLAKRLAVLPLDLDGRSEPVYLCSVRDGLLTYNHRMPSLEYLTISRAILSRSAGVLRKGLALIRRR